MKKDERWFRFYARMIDSPQVLELSDAEFRLIVSTWALACDDRGNIPFSPAALRRRVMPDHSADEVTAMVDHLIELDLLNRRDDGFTVPRWDDHQYIYASQTPEAKAAQKTKERKASESTNEPPLSQECRKNVASESHEMDTQNRIDSDSEKNLRVCTQRATGDPKPKVVRDAFVPPTRQECDAFFADIGIPECAEKFFDHFENCRWRLSSGTGAVMKDWRLAAKHWQRNESRFGQNRINTTARGQPSSSSGLDPDDPCPSKYQPGRIA